MPVLPVRGAGHALVVEDGPQAPSFSISAAVPDSWSACQAVHHAGADAVAAGGASGRCCQSVGAQMKVWLRRCQRLVT